MVIKLQSRHFYSDLAADWQFFKCVLELIIPFLVNCFDVVDGRRLFASFGGEVLGLKLAREGNLRLHLRTMDVGSSRDPLLRLVHIHAGGDLGLDGPVTPLHVALTFQRVTHFQINYSLSAQNRNYLKPSTLTFHLILGLFDY
jgi:hypothetical protein